jgi:hypothetical protein
MIRARSLSGKTSIGDTCAGKSMSPAFVLLDNIKNIAANNTASEVLALIIVGSLVKLF